jgi:hypothetical protein
MLKAPKAAHKWDENRLQGVESRCVTHQLGAKAFRTPLCDSLHGWQYWQARCCVSTEADAAANNQTGARRRWAWTAER